LKRIEVIASRKSNIVMARLVRAIHVFGAWKMEERRGWPA
jgi:hypothetical protein